MTDREAIQGLWRVVSYISRGGSVTSGSTHYQFDGNRVKEITPSLVDGGEWGTFELDPESRPKQLTVTYEWVGKDGQPVTRTHREAYELEGDILRMCTPSLFGVYPEVISDTEHSVVTLVRDTGPPPVTKQRSERKPINDQVLGTLTWDDNFDEWNARIELTPRLAVDCHLNPRGGQDESTIEAGRELVKWLRKNESAARGYAASQLLNTHNDHWNDEKAISARTFASRMTLETLAIRADGSAELYYRDDNLFWGHCIIVSLSADRLFTGATIAG